MVKERCVQGDSRLWEELTEAFLFEVCRKHHYAAKDMELLRKVAADMRICMKGQEGFCYSYPKEIPQMGNLGNANLEAASSVETNSKEINRAQDDSKVQNVFVTVVMTLGAGIDLLQERYHRTERLLESYMLESISGELLIRGYQQLNDRIGKETGWYAVKMHFFGSEDRLLLRQMPEVLQRMGQKKVTCTKDYCLRPQKSVVYQIELSMEQDKKCADLCDTCDRKEVCSFNQNSVNIHRKGVY